MKSLKFYAECDDGSVLSFKESVSDGVRRFALPVSQFESKISFCVSSRSFDMKAGDEGYYLLPGDEKAAGTALIRFLPLSEDEKLDIDNPTLSFFAVADASATYVVTIENNYFYHLAAEYREGAYRIYARVKTEDQPAEDDFVLRVMTLAAGADYNDVARTIRNYRLSHGQMRPLADKCREREALEYARKYPLVRVRMGWKPVPPEVLHQTPENEPPMYVACTFAEVRYLAERMKAHGVEGAEISLVGWNAKGHDGRWPDLYPVEELLGGESELRKTVEYVRSLGYKLTCHTNNADHYEIAATFSRDDLAKTHDGSLRSHGKWGGGAAYAACPVTQYRYAERDAGELARLGFFGIHYVDCLSLCRPDTCFDPNHRVTLPEVISIYRKMMKLYTDALGGFSSEGMRDFSVGELDFSLYNCFRSTRLSFVAKDYKMVSAIIPMIELIYHGTVLYNVSSATVNAVIKGDEARSVLALLGGKPALYINSKFLRQDVKAFSGISNNWMGEEDLTSGSEAELEFAARAVKEAADEYEVLSDRQLVFIDRYDMLDGGVCVMRYEDGVEIAANFGAAPAEYRGREIAPSKYVVLR